MNIDEKKLESSEMENIKMHNLLNKSFDISSGNRTRNIINFIQLNVYIHLFEPRKYIGIYMLNIGRECSRVRGRRQPVLVSHK